MNYNSYLEYFNIFLKKLKIIFPDNEVQEILNNIENQTDEQKIERGTNFSRLINDENFELLLKSKVKLFSHKEDTTKQISESLFGEKLSLKGMINNQPEDIKKVIWTFLQFIYLYSGVEKNKSKIKQLENVLELTKKKEKSNDEVKDKLHEMFGNDVNNQTTGMLDDIVNSFEQILSNSNGNPIAGILNISQQISTKYADKINNGEIELHKLMGSITKTVPGMGNVGNMDDMMKDMMGQMGPIGDMLSAKEKKSEEKVIIDENFSTANVELGKVDENNNNMKIGNMLKMADSFGVLPLGGKKKEDNPILNTDDINMENIMPQFGKVIGLLQKLETTNNENDMNNLRNEMDEFLSKDLGVNINEINQQIETLKEINIIPQ